MSDLEKRLNQIEQKMDAVVNIPSPYYGASVQQNNNDEIDLRELWHVLWQGKWWIIGITFLFAVAGIFYALSLPNIYKSEGIYAPAQQQSGGGLASQYGGLAAIAGVNLGSDSSDLNQAIELVISWPFLERVVNKYELKPFIMGVNGWNRDSGELTWDDSIYDNNSGKWMREPPPGRLAEPSSYEVYSVLKKMIAVDYDAKIGMITLSVEYFSPVLAQQWVGMIVNELNTHFQLRDMAKSKKSINYLEKKIKETGITGMQSVFYGMIESQMQTLMLSEVDDSYLLDEVVAPQIPELRSSPRRGLIAFLFTFLGGFFSVIFVLVRGMLTSPK